MAGVAGNHLFKTGVLLICGVLCSGPQPGVVNGNGEDSSGNGMLYNGSVKVNGKTGYYSMVVFDELYNLTQEQHDILAYNYTKMQFTPNKPVKVNVPISLAFDNKSPLAKYLRTGEGLPLYRGGVGVEGESQGAPLKANFFDYPKNGILSDLYRYEFSSKKVPKSFQQKVSDPHLVNKDHLKLMLENAFTLPRNNDRNSSLKDDIGQYILRKFGTLGLLSGTQVFIPSQFKPYFWPTLEDHEVPAGSNIIGIYPGSKYGTKEDKIVVVGAHWDTIGATDGFNDNGSGIAATIEIARAIIESDCKLKYTVIFVCFDKEEQGGQGSHEFNRGFLVKHLNTSDWPEFQGALVMDTLLNFNSSVNSQVLPKSWIAASPLAFDKIAQNNFKGDFLGIIYRTEAERQLAGLMRQHNENLKEDEVYRDNVVQHPNKFKYVEFPVDMPSEPPGLETLFKYAQFLRSDHARFWYAKELTYSLSLRAVLISDTGPYRGIMQQCYHQECDSKRGKHKGEFANYDFLAQTVQTVIDAVTDMAGATCYKSDRANRLKRYSEAEKGGSSWIKNTDKEKLENRTTGPATKSQPTPEPMLSVADLLDDAENEVGDDPGSPAPVKSAANGASSMGSLANTAIYITYFFKWIPSIFVMG